MTFSIFFRYYSLQKNIKMASLAVKRVQNELKDLEESVSYFLKYILIILKYSYFSLEYRFKHVEIIS